MPVDYPYIASVLGRLEGAGITKGYVPVKNGVPLGVSGVTIGTGVDLGQQSSTGLVSMGVPPEVIRKLTPYLGAKKEAAQALLKRLPLALSAEEVKALDDAVFARYTRDIEARYNRDNPAQKFSYTPRQAQAVVVSLLYHRGLSSPSKFPNTWKALLRGDWADAAARLCNGSLWDGYQARRAQEGALLKSIGGC